MEYQEQAVTAAQKILEAHNGVFIADVVGLGKTYVTAMLLQQLQGRTLVVCPPVLEDYWRETFVDFGIRAYRIESLGKLDHILRDGHEKYEHVVLDEAHRFRNETTQRYEQLHQIAFGKKVICVSATPLNNEMSDIYSLFKLFQTPRRSTIPGVRDLKRFFDERELRLRQYDRRTPQYDEAAQAISEEVRDRVLMHVMIRCTRSEIEQYYAEDRKSRAFRFRRSSRLGVSCTCSTRPSKRSSIARSTGFPTLPTPGTHRFSSTRATWIRYGSSPSATSGAS